MAAYATVAELARVAIDGWDELAQFSTRNPQVTGDMLEQVYNDEPLDDLSLNTDAADGLAELTDTLENVSRYADTYLNQRYRELVPLALEHYQNTGLGYAVAVIALGRMYGIRQSEEMRKTIKAQEDYLRDLASGKASLDYTQPSTPEPSGRMTVVAKPSAFDWGGY